MRFESESFAKGTREGGEKNHPPPKKKNTGIFSKNNVGNQPGIVSNSTRFCFSDGGCKRYEGGDSNLTIYFERPNVFFQTCAVILLHCVKDPGGGRL